MHSLIDFVFVDFHWVQSWHCTGSTKFKELESAAQVHFDLLVLDLSIVSLELVIPRFNWFDQLTLAIVIEPGRFILEGHPTHVDYSIIQPSFGLVDW